jgi:hypothetical protein
MQIHKLQRSIVVRSAILLLCGLGLQAGPVTYTYSGATFDSYIQNGGTGSNGDLVLISNQNDVIGSVTLNAALQNTSAQTDYTGHVISWSLTVEGAFTKSSASGNSLQNLSFGTTNGVITSWDVFSDDGSPVGGQPADWQVARIVTSSTSTFAGSHLCTGCNVYDGGLDGSFAQQIVNRGGSASSAGSWSGATAAAAPEPATLPMLLGGFALLAAKFRRKF